MAKNKHSTYYKIDTGRDHFAYAASQWETTLQCNVVSHWLGAYSKWYLNWKNSHQRKSVVIVFKSCQPMMTSSNGNIFHVTGPLCGEFTGEFPSQRPVTRSFDVFFDLRMKKQLSKQFWGWWFETSSRSLWRRCNEILFDLWTLCFQMF